MGEKDLINFLNSPIGSSKHFKWKEALWLPQWGFHSLPTQDIALNIIETANRMDAIRNIIVKPIYVTSWYRPLAYNRLIGGAKSSYHTSGLAVDFIVKGYQSDAVRELLIDFLEKLEIRMEDLSGASWVHIDLGKPMKTGRFFKP